MDNKGDSKYSIRLGGGSPLDKILSATKKGKGKALIETALVYYLSNVSSGDGVETMINKDALGEVKEGESYYDAIMRSEIKREKRPKKTSKSKARKSITTPLLDEADNEERPF
jgi:ribosomal 30S subunit maturation factor RimM